MITRILCWIGWINGGQGGREVFGVAGLLTGWEAPARTENVALATGTCKPAWNFAFQFSQQEKKKKLAIVFSHLSPFPFPFSTFSILPFHSLSLLATSFCAFILVIYFSYM
jgi:hypothetical protein